MVMLVFDVSSSELFQRAARLCSDHCSLVLSSSRRIVSYRIEAHFRISYLVDRAVLPHWCRTPLPSLIAMASSDIMARVAAIMAKNKPGHADRGTNTREREGEDT